MCEGGGIGTSLKLEELILLSKFCWERLFSFKGAFLGTGGVLCVRGGWIGAHI